MRVISRLSEPRMTFFTLDTGNHHDFALMEVASDAPFPRDDSTGLPHVAFKVGSSIEEFGQARRLLEGSGSPILPRRRGASARECTCSIQTERVLDLT